MMKLVTFIFVVCFISCKTKTTIDPPPIVEAEEVIKIEDSYEPIGNDFIYGKVIHNDSTTTDLVAIKLTVNDSICVNAYADFDGAFSINYKDSMIDDTSYFEFVFRGYTIKKVVFNDFLKNDKVHLDKKGELVTYEQYRNFYEKMRSCTR